MLFASVRDGAPSPAPREGVLQREGGPFPGLSLSVYRSFPWISVQPTPAPPGERRRRFPWGAGSLGHPSPSAAAATRSGRGRGLCPRWGAGPLVLRANLHRARRRARECPPHHPLPDSSPLTAPPQLLPPDVAGGGRGQGARSLELSFLKVSSVARRAPSPPGRSPGPPRKLVGGPLASCGSTG